MHITRFYVLFGFILVLISSLALSTDSLSPIQNAYGLKLDCKESDFWKFIWKDNCKDEPVKKKEKISEKQKIDVRTIEIAPGQTIKIPIVNSNPYGEKIYVWFDASGRAASWVDDAHFATWIKPEQKVRHSFTVTAPDNIRYLTFDLKLDFKCEYVQKNKKCNAGNSLYYDFVVKGTLKQYKVGDFRFSGPGEFTINEAGGYDKFKIPFGTKQVTNAKIDHIKFYHSSNWSEKGIIQSFFKPEQKPGQQNYLYIQTNCSTTPGIYELGIVGVTDKNVQRSHGITLIVNGLQSYCYR